MNYQTEAVDSFIDQLTPDERESFTRGDLSDWVRATYDNWTPSLQDASMMLQIHRTDRNKRHVLGCSGHGPGAYWYVAAAEDAARMTTRLVTETAEHARVEVLSRIIPAAAQDAAVLARTRFVVDGIEALLDVLVRMVTGPAANGDTP